MRLGWAFALGLSALSGCQSDSLCGNSDYAALCPNNYPPEPPYDAGGDAGAAMPGLMDAALLDASTASDAQSSAADASDAGG